MIDANVERVGSTEQPDPAASASNQASAPSQAGESEDRLPASLVAPAKVSGAELAERLPRAQHAALAALSGGIPFAEAAKAAGVHRATVYRWLESDPLFRAAYNAWQQELRASARARLLKLADDAIDVVTKELRLHKNEKVAMALLNKLGVLTGRGGGQTDPELLKEEMELDRKERQQLLAARGARHILDKAGFSPRQQRQHLRQLPEPESQAS